MKTSIISSTYKTNNGALNFNRSTWMLMISYAIFKKLSNNKNNNMNQHNYNYSNSCPVCKSYFIKGRRKLPLWWKPIINWKNNWRISKKGIPFNPKFKISKSKTSNNNKKSYNSKGKSINNDRRKDNKQKHSLILIKMNWNRCSSNQSSKWTEFKN